MKALVCTEYGRLEDLEVQDLPDPQIKKGHVLIDVAAAGINFPDILLVQGKYQMRPPLPCVPGTEVAGIVAEVGEGVTHVKPGDRVIGYNMTGAFAEKMLTPAVMVTPVPDGIDLAVAAGFTTVYGTTYHALKQRAAVQPGETLLVLGAAGGVGLAAVELGKAMGAHVIAAASTDAKLQVCRDHGADEVINYATEDLKERIKALTGGKGADVIYDPVGGEYAEPALRASAWNGRYLVIGFAAGDIPRIPLNLTLLKGCAIVGVFWGAFTQKEPEVHQQNMKDLMALLGSGKIRPLVSARYGLEDYGQAFDSLLERKVTGKIVFEMAAAD